MNCRSLVAYVFSFLVLAASLAGIAPRLAWSQEGEAGAAATSNVPIQARKLVVAIRSYEPGRSLPQIGAGVIIGTNSERVYIATALHVVDGAERIWVSFESARSDSLAADTVSLPGAGQSLDLAVIAVARDRVPAGFETSLDRLGRPGALETGARVSPVGCPDEVCWSAPSPPDRVLSVTPLDLLFQSSFVKRGSSGGALFDEWWEVVGIVTTSDPPRAQAIPIDYVVEQVATWGIPVSLHRPTVPRGGYAVTADVSVLFPSASFSERAPSGRVGVSFAVRRPLTVELSLLRLAPDPLDGCPDFIPDDATPEDSLSLANRAPCELVMNAGTVGVGVRLTRGRVSAHPFVEGGIGRIRGRWDTGGFFETATGEYLPDYDAEEFTTVVLGGGLSLELIIFPRGIVRVLGGYWGYDDPFNVDGFPETYFPKLPHFFFGGGAQIGL